MKSKESHYPPDDCQGADGSAPVQLLSDGRLIVVQDGVIHAFDPDGTAMDGWPHELHGAPATACIPGGCTPGTNSVVPPVLDADGTMYLVVYEPGPSNEMTADIVALDPSAASLPGWPREVPKLDCYPDTCPFPVPRVIRMDISPDGHIYIVAAEGLIRAR